MPPKPNRIDYGRGAAFFLRHLFVGSFLRAWTATETGGVRVALVVPAILQIASVLGVGASAVGASMREDGQWEWPERWGLFLFGGLWAVTFLQSIWAEFLGLERERNTLSEEKAAMLKTAADASALITARGVPGLVHNGSISVPGGGAVPAYAVFFEELEVSNRDLSRPIYLEFELVLDGPYKDAPNKTFWVDVPAGELKLIRTTVALLYAQSIVAHKEQALRGTRLKVRNRSFPERGEAECSMPGQMRF